MQRYTISGEKSCVATREGSRSLTAVQRHTFSQAKTCVASTEREKKTNRSHTTLHNTIRSSHKTTTHHITSYHNHTQTRQHYQQTNPIPYLKHHTPPHIQQKPFPKKGGRALLKYIRANWASNLLDSRAYRRPKPAIARSNYIVPDQPVPSTDRIP